MPASKRNVSQSEGKPIVVTVGRTTVRIYPRAAERGRKACFKISDYSTGKRRFLSFLDEKEARTEAARIAARINAGDAAGASMTGDDRALLVRATELVAPYNLDPQTACSLFAEAAKLVGPHNVVAAAKAYAKRSPAARERLLLSKAKDEYIRTKEAKKRSPRHLSDLKSRLGRFVTDHPGKVLEDFDTGDIQNWLDRLKNLDGAAASALTRRNFATVLGGFFEHYRRRGILAENPCADLERESLRSEGDIDFWTPKEAETLLRAIPENTLPAFVLSLFCGLRTAEAARIRWEHVNLAERHVEIRADIAKTASRRLIPIPDNAVEWLVPFQKKPKERVFPEHDSNLSQRVSEAAKAVGVRRVENGARHSFVTYRTALTGDIPRTAMEAGNSPGVVHRHYRALATKADAAAFFSVRPYPAANVVPMPAVA
jgi:integrase